MTTTSLVISLDPQLQRRALRALDLPDLLLGPVVANRLAAVLHSPNASSDRDAVDRLLDIPGVTAVEIVAIRFDYPYQDIDSSPSGRRP